jgi:hypothetical protein
MHGLTHSPAPAPDTLLVMAALGPAIHVFAPQREKTSMPGPIPGSSAGTGMTAEQGTTPEGMTQREGAAVTERAA